MLTEDDTYEGYYLPKGTIIFANAWTIHRDVNEYDEPDRFLPERYLNNKFGSRNLGDKAQDHRRTTYSFGAGRRVCPGQHLAENSLVRLRSSCNCKFELTRETTDAQYGKVDVELRHIRRYG